MSPRPPASVIMAVEASESIAGILWARLEVVPHAKLELVAAHYQVCGRLRLRFHLDFEVDEPALFAPCPNQRGPFAIGLGWKVRRNDAVGKHRHAGGGRELVETSS